VPVTFSTTGLSCGTAFFDTIDPSAYEGEFTFTGQLDRVVVDLTGELLVNPAAEMTRLMAQQ
jgi:arylsulfatase